MYILYLYFILLFAACSRTFRYAWLPAQPVFSCLYLCVCQCVSQSVGVRVMQIFRLPSTVGQSEFYDFCLLPLDSYNIRVYIQYLNNRYAVLSNFPFKVLTLIARLPIHTHRNTVKTRPLVQRTRLSACKLFHFHFHILCFIPPLLLLALLNVHTAAEQHKKGEPSTLLYGIYVYMYSMYGVLYRG